jgi:hypothetical protein
MNSNKKKNNKQNSQPWGVVRLGSFRAEFPQPRLPRILGADRSLSSERSVYPFVNLDVPIGQVTSLITAGGAAASVPLDLTQIPSFSTRFASLFREYAIVGARLELRLNNTLNNAGLVCGYLDEQSSAAPTANECASRPRLDMLLTQQFQPGSYRMSWKPRDLLDLDFVNTATTFTPVWLKIFTNVANFGTTASTTGQVIVTGTLALVFRGYV